MSQDEVEVGTCSLCGQEMIRTEDDCWHPWNVSEPCPYEPSHTDTAALVLWWNDHPGHKTGRPGRQYFVPRVDN